MAHDLLLGRLARSHTRESASSSSGLEVKPVTDYLQKNPPSYRTKTGVLLTAGLLVFIFSRQRRE